MDVVRTGTAVRILRENLGLKQDELAERANMHVSKLGEIERGYPERKRQRGTYETLSKALNERADYLQAIGEDREPLPEPAANNPDVGAALSMIIRQLGRLAEAVEGIRQDIAHMKERGDAKQPAAAKTNKRPRRTPQREKHHTSTTS